MSKANLTFYGGVGEVTGANFLLDAGTEKLLVDCGLFQGCPMCGEKNAEPFPYDPASIDAVLVTHAHIDHIGRIPKLVKDGFRGAIYSTPPTKELSALIFEDGFQIMEEEAREEGRVPLYGKEHVGRALSLWKTIPYGDHLTLGGLSVFFKDAGHILGSAFIEIQRSGKKLVFTGDLGNSPMPLLRDTERLDGAHYLVMESVYGDRVHEAPQERHEKLEDIIENTARNNGVLLIPAFSMERTQEVLYEIERMVEHRRTPRIFVFVDSPLASRITEVYRRSQEYFNKSVLTDGGSRDELFSFSGLVFTVSVEESKAIKKADNPKIIMAGSGMSEGGRILFHEREYLPDPKNTILFVGYQAPGTRGRAIQDGAQYVKIFDDDVPVNARVETIRGYSSHKDSDGLLDFAAHTADTLQKTFVVMGEPKAAAFFTQRLRDYLGVDAVAPQAGETFELDF